MTVFVAAGWPCDNYDWASGWRAAANVMATDIMDEAADEIERLRAQVDVLRARELAICRGEIQVRLQDENGALALREER